jgi:hypothetical protein
MYKLAFHITQFIFSRNPFKYGFLDTIGLLLHSKIRFLYVTYFSLYTFFIFKI